MTLLTGARLWWGRARLHMLPPGDAGVVVGGSILVVLAVGGFWAFATGSDPDTWVPTLLLIALATVSIPICAWVARGDRRLRKILLLGFAVKMLCLFPRYYVNEYVYDGEADTGNYHTGGQQVVLNLREEGRWSLEGSLLDAYSDETKTVGYFAGGLYLVVGTTYLGGYIVFTWVCWVGLLLFFRAFQIAYPNAPPYLAALLIFFLPSVLYWPSAVGKDAVMVLCIGGVTLAMARLLTPSRPFLGLALLGPSAWLMVRIRPHLLMICLVGAGVSLLARNAGVKQTRVAVASRVLLVIALVPVLIFGLGRMDATFGDPSAERSFSIGSTLEQASDQSSIGGSAFEAQPVTNPLDMPIAVVSVLYRPFPFEVNSIPVLISALEGTLLLIGTLLAGRWIWRVGPAALQHPFAAYCAGYVLAFVFAFSNIGNAGILARQRVQMFPVLMLLVAAAYEHHRAATSDLQSPTDLTEPETRGGSFVALAPT